MLFSKPLFVLHWQNFNLFIFLAFLATAAFASWIFFCKNNKDLPFETERIKIIATTSVAAIALLFIFWQEAKNDTKQWLQDCYDRTSTEERKCITDKDIEKKYKKLTGEEIQKTTSDFPF